MTNNKNIRIIIWPLMTIIVYGTLRSVIYDRFSPWLWGYLNLQEGTWLDITSVIAALCLIVAGWKHKRAKYSAFHIGAYCSIIILLLFFWLDNSSTPLLKAFGKYPVWLLLFCSYTLGLFSHFIYGIIPRKPRVSEFEHSSILLFQDLPVENLDDDKLRFQELAKRIASSILEYSGDRSLSIGITGAWGTGKTTLLNFVKNYLLTCKDVIIIDFSPRQSAAVQDIQKDFLFELGKSLAIYHSGAQKVTERYMHAIGTLPDSLWAARVVGAIGSRNVSEKRKEISDIISEIGKRVIVFVDDFDRLTGEEIQEVLKLIDKNAAFKGTFYLTAYDKTHTNSVIASYQGDATGTRDYTDKP